MKRAMTRRRVRPDSLQSFEQQAVAMIGRVRSAISAVIAAMPGNLRKATDLHRAAELDMKLSWRLFKVVGAADPLLAGPHIPGAANIRTFVRAASRVGVDPKLLATVEAAAGDFERFVVTHADDRSAFDSMISALAKGADADQANLQQRRAAFRANRHLWGVQARTQVKCVFTDIGDDPGMVNVAVVDGYVGIRQLRRSAPLIAVSARVADDAGAPLPVRREPIDPRSESEHGLALLRDFCSHPLPGLREVRAAAGFVCGELVNSDVGNNGAVTCFTGWRARNVASRYRATHNLHATTHGSVRVPCESIIICLLSRRGIFGDATPQLAVYSDHRAELPYPCHLQRMDDLLLPDEGVAYLGHGANVLSTPEVPWLGEMAQYVLDRMGWDGDDFDVHRCRIAYPVLPSTVAINIDLPKRPG